MDERFLMYRGLKDEYEHFFRPLINEFNFKVIDVSDSGIHFANNRCSLDITYETGIQVWLKIPKYNIVEMIPKLSMSKGDHIFKKYMVATQKADIKESMIELSYFLIENFAKELSES